jgi:predicted amino acid racemase
MKLRTGLLTMALGCALIGLAQEPSRAQMANLQKDLDEAYADNYTAKRVIPTQSQIRRCILVSSDIIHAQAKVQAQLGLDGSGRPFTKENIFKLRQLFMRADQAQTEAKSLVNREVSREAGGQPHLDCDAESARLVDYVVNGPDQE